MKMPTAVVAEDEAPQHAELCRLLGAVWPELRIIASCEDGLTALEALHEHQPDVAFLDIRMPGVSGLEVARGAPRTTHIVFTTAYDEYAVEAFERGAIDYLLKPVSRERLELSLQRLRERLAAGDPADMSAMLAALKAGPSRAQDRIRWITATIGNTTRMFPIEDVLFFRAQDKYTRVVTAGDEAQIRMPLKELIGVLDPDEFWQIHRSAIVRAAAIHSVRRQDDGRWLLKLKGHSEELPVSGVFQHQFRGM
jgi:DNA-binding LytR/AlgR family response regulator